MKVETQRGSITAPIGFSASAVASGIKKEHRLDLALIVSDRPCAAAGTFTQNRVKAAPVLLTMEHLKTGNARAVVCNSGNANACTGEKGIASARLMAKTVASAVGCEPHQVLVASTGVIGVPMPDARVEKGILDAVKLLGSSHECGDQAAQAIMTTDTKDKQVMASLEIGGKTVTIGGMAKGSGMIHPNMATMLAFLTTDAAISSELLQQALKEAVNTSFNMITVDGDTSTNDMCLILANGAAQNPAITESGSDYQVFYAALEAVCVELAKQIAADGEGATCLIEVQVSGARTLKDARAIARAVAGSSLVKTAVFGNDANWGRILCAAGYSGAVFNPETTDIYLGDVLVARDGAGVEFSEEAASQVLKQPVVVLKVVLKEGPCSATAWGCDLTHEYVDINASYRT